IERDLILGQLAALDQQLADRDIGPAVLPVIAEADHAAAREPHFARALHFEEERIDGIVHPAKREFVRIERAAFDLGARRIWHEIARHDLAGDALAAPFR